MLKEKATERKNKIQERCFMNAYFSVLCLHTIQLHHTGGKDSHRAGLLILPFQSRLNEPELVMELLMYKLGLMHSSAQEVTQMEMLPPQTVHRLPPLPD